jgi:hypothetical protein
MRIHQHNRVFPKLVLGLLGIPVPYPFRIRNGTKDKIGFGTAL